MQNRGVRIAFLLFAIFVVSSIYIISAQENVSTDAVSDTSAFPGSQETAGGVGGDETTSTPETEEQDVSDLITEAESFDEELQTSGGLTPGSPLYFVDTFFDGFQSDASVREEKVSEMKVLALKCGEGDAGACEDVETSFEKYKEHADKFEKEVSPEEKEDAARSSKAIRGAIVRDIAQNLEPGKKDELIREVVQKEKNIETAAEVAGKIKELCSQLSELDPSQYAKVCSAGGDAPLWQRDLDKTLTDEQKKEAEAFFDVMTECMKSSGKTCRCEDIGVTAFSEQCSVVAPLAVKCEKGDEEACDEMEIESEEMMDSLPPHLRNALINADEFEREQYNSFMPPECVEAGVTDHQGCFKVMFKVHAPPECQLALEEGTITATTERQAREQCEKIMFEANAPPECIEAGLKNPKECGSLMFTSQAPEECIKAGITGESRADPEKCRELMESFRGEEGEFRGPPRGGFGGGDCMSMQDPEKRLECFDNAAKGAVSHFEDKRGFEDRFKETKQKERQCSESCYADGSAWDFTNGQCTCKNREEFKRPEEYQRQQYGYEGKDQYQRPPEGQQYPRDDRYTGPEGEERTMEWKYPQEGQYPKPPEGQQYPMEGQYPKPPEGQQYPSPEQGGYSGTMPPGESSGSYSSQGGYTAPSGGESSSGSSGGESAPSSSGGQSAPATGGFIYRNRFLGYWFR